MNSTSFPHLSDIVRTARRFGQASAIAFVLAVCMHAAPLHAMPSCPANIDRATPDADLIDNGDATVTHLSTGLTWKKCSEGYSGDYCTGPSTAFNWIQAQDAATAANNANFAGHNDWRVPNYKELQSIVETGCQNPSINWTRFPNTPPGQYWTSTGYGNAPIAWYVHFITGGSGAAERTMTYNVRLVRGGSGFGAFDSTVAGTKVSTGPSPTGTGTISASFTGGGAGCHFAYSQFALPEAPLPAGVTLPHGLFDFSVYGCTAASVLTVTITYPATLPAGTVYWKYGPTAANTAPHWYILPATIAGNQVQYTVTDGQLGDDDLAANGHVTDPGGVGTDRIFGAGFE